MPEYEFTNDETGETVEVYLSMADAPPIGSQFQHEGQTLTRIASSDMRVNGDPIAQRYPVVSNSLPRFLKGCKHGPTGKPIIENREHAARVCGEQGFYKEN